MSKKIRWGILSTAKINDALLEPIRQAERSELAAVASRNKDKAQAYAQEKGIPKAYGSYEALLADPDIDTIYISLPNTLHCEWTVKAAEAGKHVLLVHLRGRPAHQGRTAVPPTRRNRLDAEPRVAKIHRGVRFCTGHPEARSHTGRPQGSPSGSLP